MKLLIFALFIFQACQAPPPPDPTKRPGVDRDYNVIENYVRKPVDQAGVVNKYNDQHNKKLDSALEKLD